MQIISICSVYFYSESAPANTPNLKINRQAFKYFKSHIKNNYLYLYSFFELQDIIFLRRNGKIKKFNQIKFSMWLSLYEGTILILNLMEYEQMFFSLFNVFQKLDVGIYIFFVFKKEIILRKNLINFFLKDHSILHDVSTRIRNIWQYLNI